MRLTRAQHIHSRSKHRGNECSNDLIKGSVIRTGEFGWEWEKFNDFATKASYFWTIAQYNSDLKDQLERIAEDLGLTLKNDDSNGYSYVDHGGEHYENLVINNPEISTDAGLIHFLTDSACWIYLGNDNQQPPPNFYLTEEQVKSAEKNLVLDCDEYFSYAMLAGKNEETYATEAFWAWKEKYNPWWSSGNQLKFPKIKSVKDGVITFTHDTYDYKVEKTITGENQTLTYTIK